MPFLVDAQTLKAGLIIFRRADVQHRNWYCRIKLPNVDRYKTFSLKTPDINAARDLAFDQDAEVRFSVKHDIPVFKKPFSQVAQEFSAFQKERAEAGQISHHRWRVLDSHIRAQLNRYIGNVQISQIGKESWASYPVWRQKNGQGRSGGRVSEGTIRDEMATFRAILGYAARKHYIREAQIPNERLPLSKARREEFTPAEYRKLHNFARSWIKEARNSLNSWYRTVAYNFVLIMANTGMRPSEAKNLQWRDISVQADKQGRPFVRLNVRGKGKHRHLVAASTVATYLDRIRAISKAKEPTDYVFSKEKRSSRRNAIPLTRGGAADRF